MDVVIVGAGGAGREAYGAFLEDNQDRSSKWNVLGFVDENPSLQGRAVCDLPVLGDFEFLQQNARKNFAVLCPVGNPAVRKSLVQRVAALGLRFCSIVHPSVTRSRWTNIGPGSIVCAGTVITTHVEIGPYVVINIGCTISHDTHIGAYCNINPGCHLAGAVQLGEGVDLGMGAVVIQNKSIGDWSIIGAGAVVTNDLPACVTAVGVPCRVIKHNQDQLCLSAN